MRRLAALLALLALFVIAVIVAVVIATSTSSNAVKFRNIVGHDAQNAINKVQQLINSYTK